MEVYPITATGNTEWFQARHTSKYQIDVTIPAGITATVKIASRRIGSTGNGHNLRWPADNAQGDEIELSASDTLIVFGNREYRAVVTVSSGSGTIEIGMGLAEQAT